MKIYISEIKNIKGAQAKEVLVNQLTLRGHEVVGNWQEADVVFKEIDSKEMKAKIMNSKRSNEFKKKLKFYITEINGNINFLKEKNDENALMYSRGYKETEDVKNIYTLEQIADLQKSIINYVLGRTKTIELLDPLPFRAIVPIISISLNINREMKEAKDKVEMAKRVFGLSDGDIEILCDEVKSLTSYGESKLMSIFRKVKDLYIDGMKINDNCNSAVVPLVSDAILQNLVKAYIKWDFKKITKDEVKQEKFEKQYDKLIDTAQKIVRKSLFSKSAWDQFCAENQSQNGVYSMYIVNNQLKDGEIMIPHPMNVNINSSKFTVSINGNENAVTILHTRKAILIDGPDAKELRSEYRGKFGGYDIFVDSTKVDIKEYPHIGDEVVMSRHPITTLVLKLKVVGYTDDCSIQVNSRTALVLYGDADGDAQTVSWSRWTDGLDFGTAKDIKDFADVANIVMDTNKFHNNYSLEQFSSLQPDSIEDCIEKGAVSGIEQAQAKLVTKNVTGKFGAKERDLVQSLILNDITITHRINFLKSWLSQVNVQAKNILADMRAGKELSDIIKGTFVLYYEMSTSKASALKDISVLLGKTPREVGEIIAEWSGNHNNIEVIEKQQDFYDIW